MAGYPYTRGERFLRWGRNPKFVGFASRFAIASGVSLTNFTVGDRRQHRDIAPSNIKKLKELGRVTLKFKNRLCIGSGSHGLAVKDVRALVGFDASQAKKRVASDYSVLLELVNNVNRGADVVRFDYLSLFQNCADILLNLTLGTENRAGGGHKT
ncbi:hypothetical protein DL770_011797 [Monosporascus sp. CRB-9-2]|nr:hypothetical protein DL770_011797 [Monosporascus sp. CRB-9-2]